MRRTIVITTIAALSLAACGSSDDAVGDTSETDSPLVVDSLPGDEEPEPEPIVTEPPAQIEKPEVELPDEIPTELVRTVLEEGEGDEAVEGDTVVVDYVGVRSEDGVEFDNSYDRGQPFPLVLGSSSVIAGWEEGLVGAQAGERVQLDIPAELAYGDQQRGEEIPPGTALTFVIDVREVLEGIDPAEIPSEPGIPLTDVGVEETEFVELESGEGDELELGDTALIRYVLFRADNGAPLETQWATEPIAASYQDGAIFPGFIAGMDGMKVGEQRAITIPPADGFGPEGNPQGGLPAGTDVVLVVELVGIG